MSPEETYLLVPDVKILVDGSPIPAELIPFLIRVDVNLPLNASGRFEFAISDPDWKLYDDSLFDFGKLVEIDLGYTGATKKVIKAEITRRSLDAGRSGEPQLLIGGADKLSRLKRSYNTRSFLDMTSSDVIDKVAGESGLSVNCEATKVKEPYLLQNNTSDFDFIAGLAAEAGLDFIFADDKLSCAKPDYSASPVVTFTWGESMMAFRPRFSTAPSAASIEVVGWDPKAKKAIRATAKPEGASGGGKSTVTESGDLARVVQVAANVTSQAEAERLAKSLVADGLAHGITALCEARGTPLLTPGCMVELAGVGKALSGNYMVTSVKHRMNGRGYLTFFEVRRNKFEVERARTSKSETEAAEEAKVDIEVLVIDALEEPMPNADYTLTLSDGSQRQGKTDSNGNLKEPGVPKGGYKIELAEYEVTLRGRA